MYKKKKIRLTAKGAAWLALQENGFIDADMVCDDRFEKFWDEFKIFIVKRLAWKLISNAISFGFLGVILGYLVGVIL